MNYLLDEVFLELAMILSWKFIFCISFFPVNNSLYVFLLSTLICFFLRSRLV
jgi:hypothetical protein